MVPLGSILQVSETTGPDSAMRYNGFRSADLNGAPAPGYSSGQAQAAIARILDETLPKGMSFEWTDLTYQQILAGNTALLVFPSCVLLVFLVLAAQYESLFLPLAIILIVEFTRELEVQGRKTLAAATELARLRLRPILMTSFAFIMGVVALVLSSGAGAEMRHAMVVAVFFGMLGVTFFGLFLTPAFYVPLRAGETPHRLGGDASSSRLNAWRECERRGRAYYPCALRPRQPRRRC